MHIYNVSLPGELHLRLVLPHPVFDDVHARLLLGAYLPGSEFSYQPADPTLTITFKQSHQQRLVRGSGKVTVFDQWRGQASLLDFIHLTYGACRLYWLQHGLYSVHSACVDDLLVVGHSGAGKTSTALRLAGKGRKLFSTNKTLLRLNNGMGLLEAVAGTKTVTTKESDVERHLPGYRERLSYVGRSAFLLDDGMYSAATSMAIKRIAIVQLNDGADAHEELSALSALHRLFPFFLDAVNADAVVCGGNAVLAGTPPRGIQQTLAERLLPALSHVRVCAVTGSMSFVETALESHHG